MINRIQTCEWQKWFPSSRSHPCMPKSVTSTEDLRLTFINSFEYSHIHTSIKWDLHSLTQLLLHSFIHPLNFTSSLAHLISHTFDRTLTNSPMHSFTQIFTCLLYYSHLRNIHTFYPFIHTPIQSLISKEIVHDDSLTHWIIHTLNQPSIGHGKGLCSRSDFFCWISLIKNYI